MIDKVTDTLEGIASDERIRGADRLPEFVYLVLYHGDRPWTAPDRVADLFERSDPDAVPGTIRS